MRDLITQDLPFTKKEVPLKEAMAYFEAAGYDDKVRLLKYRRKPYLTLYSLGQRMDYHHGYMVPSTGYLRWFDLTASNGGFTLRFPRRHSPTELEPMTAYPQLLKAFRLYGDWLDRLGIGSDVEGVYEYLWRDYVRILRDGQPEYRHHPHDHHDDRDDDGYYGPVDEELRHGNLPLPGPWLPAGEEMHYCFAPASAA